MLSLADAILDNNIDLVKQAMQYGVSLNDLDEYGFTPLIEATIANNNTIADLLIRYGANARVPDSIGGTALHWAAENNNIPMCKLLVENHADPNAYNANGQPVLIMPLLRQQQPLKKFLIEHGADLTFAQDYLNTKLLGHMFELVGTADIIDPKNEFVEVDFEGFFLEVTLGMIAESLHQFKNHFVAREVRRYNHFTQAIVDTIQRSAELIKYQQYNTNLKLHKQKIESLLQQEPIIIPIGYEGHAITFIKLGHILVKCDRREDSRLYDNIVIYQMQRPSVLNADFIQRLIYEKQSSEFVNTILPDLLELQPVTELKVTAQISGNCSWANVEACIPALYFLLFGQYEDFQENMSKYKSLALSFFHQWREWNKDRSLQFCIDSFKQSDSVRKACKAEILAAILFQSCNTSHAIDHHRAEMIMSILLGSPYEYVLQSYVRAYSFEDVGEEGKNFLRMLRSFGYRV